MWGMRRAADRCLSCRAGAKTSISFVTPACGGVTGSAECVPTRVPNLGRAAPRNAKGARHCCQAPCRRTAAVDPDGSSAWFRRHPRLAPARACEPRVGRRGWPLSTHPERELRLPASAARFVSSAGGRKSEALLDASLRSIPPGPSASLAQRVRLANLPAGRSFAPETGRLRTPFREPGFQPLSASSFRLGRCLRSTLRFRPNRAPASLETSAAPGRHFGFATSGASHPRTISECGFPKAPAPFPARVNL